LHRIAKKVEELVVEKKGEKIAKEGMTSTSVKVFDNFND